jgi:tetratricopeptide (TPR) repeat protein
MASRQSVGRIVTARRGLWLAAAGLTIAFGGLLGGWWLAQRGIGSTIASRSRIEAQQQVNLLKDDVARGTATRGQQQRLLELLLALRSNAEATSLLERMADQQPDRWPLRLMLAELRRSQNDRAGAEREVRQLLNINPERIEALQLMALLQWEQGRGEAAQAHLQELLQKASLPELKPQALPIGLLLADLKRRMGKASEADALYQTLSRGFPADPRPVLARALLKQQQGQTAAALEILQEARRRQPNGQDPRLDEVAAAWGIAPLRNPAAVGPASGGAVKAPSPPPRQGSGDQAAPISPPAP